jgi:hypothetical protein
MRLVRISADGAATEAECRRTVSEKVSVAVAAQAAASAALGGGKGPGAATRAALAPIKRAVRANHRRLSQARRVHSVVSNMHRLLRGGSR